MALILKVSPLSCLPTHYGGATATNEDLHWSFLPRTAALPAMKTHEFRQCRKDPKAKDLLDRLWNGDFSFSCLDMNVFTPENTNSASIIIMENDKDSGEEIQNGGCFGIKCAKRSDGMIALLPIIGNDQMYGFFYKLMPKEDMKLLSVRIIHHILQQHGTHIVPSSLLEIFFYNLQHQYAVRYGKKKSRYAEDIDLAICKVDIMASNQAPQLETAQAFLELGACLEASQQYALAAKVYQKALCLADNDKQCQYCLHHYAARALMRDGQYERSERAYFQSLHIKAIHDGQQFVMTDEESQLLISDFLHLYSTESCAPNPELRLFTDIEKRRLVLEGLLLVAGYQLPYQSQNIQKVQRYLRCFKGPCLNPLVAGRQLQKVFLKPSFDEWSQTLLSCIITGTVLTKYPDTDSVDFDKLAEEARTTNRREAKRVLKPTNIRCGNTGCGVFVETTNMKFYQCPCKQVIYCSAKCGRLHWKEHKKVCKTKA